MLVDRRPALSPFWDDFESTITRILNLRGAGGLRIVPVRAEGLGLLSDDTLEPVPLPPLVGSSALLALGDLGQYAGGLMANAWMLWGRRARRAGFTPWALCSCPQDRWSPAVADTWNLICWDRHIRPPLNGSGQRALPLATEELKVEVKRRSEKLQCLLRLVSPAIRVERGFLRDVRFLLDHTAADAGTEYDAFQSPDAVGTGSGFSLTPARQQQLRAELGQAPLQRLLPSMLALLRRHHAHSASLFGAEELEGLIACLPPELQPLLKDCGLLTPQTKEETQLHWRQLAADLLAERFGSRQQAMKSYALRSLSRVEQGTAASAAKQVIWGLNHPDHSGELPPHISPEIMAFLAGGSTVRKTHLLSLDGGLSVGAPSLQSKFSLASVSSDRRMVALHVEPVEGSGERVRRLVWSWQDGTVLTEDELRRASRIHLDAGLETLDLIKMSRPPGATRPWHDRQGLHAEVRLTDSETHRFDWEMQPVLRVADGPEGRLVEQGCWTAKSKPAWAEVLALNTFGLRAEFNIRSVNFVLRWVPPGRFLMGSPEDEQGRLESEGPQHEVVITRGFWMGETPVTQEQWQAVMGENPSQFKGSRRPVEQVSWQDSQRFVQTLNGLLPGLHAALPTEAQREYACRAGTQGAFQDGSASTAPVGKDPALDKLGWFDANSGVATHEVKEKKAPNAWGLHDLHGNVWEWCRDAWDEKAYARRQTGVQDPETLADDETVARVVRGGSWLTQARYCRAAIRFRYHPGDRVRNLGLRLSAGQEPPGAEPPSPEGRRQRPRVAGEFC